MSEFRIHEARAIASAWLRDYDRHKRTESPDELINEERMALMLRLACDEIDRLTELLATITADASWCGFEGDVSVNVTLWDIPQCDGRGGLTLLQAAEKARNK